MTRATPLLSPYLLGLCAAALVGCATPSSGVVIHAADDLDAGVQIAVADLANDLRLLGAETTRTTARATRCTRGQTDIVVRGWDHEHSDLQRQEISISQKSCGAGGRLITLEGGGLQSAQWAVYALLEQLGVRYWHPEQTLYPASLVWPESVELHETPRFPRRSFHAHTTHPIELSAPLDPGDLDMAGYQKRWIPPCQHA